MPDSLPPTRRSIHSLLEHSFNLPDFLEDFASELLVLAVGLELGAVRQLPRLLFGFTSNFMKLAFDLILRARFHRGAPLSRNCGRFLRRIAAPSSLDAEFADHFSHLITRQSGTQSSKGWCASPEPFAPCIKTCLKNLPQGPSKSEATVFGHLTIDRRPRRELINLENPLRNHGNSHDSGPSELPGFRPISCMRYRFQLIPCRLVMNVGNSQQPHLESPRRHEEEVNRLLRGIRAWCVTSDESNDSATDEDCDEESLRRMPWGSQR